MDIPNKYEFRLTDVNHTYNLQRLEVRQFGGEWGTICCSHYCNGESILRDAVAFDLGLICKYMEYDNLLGYSNDFEPLDNSTLPVHLSLDSLGIGNWSQPTCNSSNNIFLICGTGKISQSSVVRPPIPVQTIFLEIDLFKKCGSDVGGNLENPEKNLTEDQIHLERLEGYRTQWCTVVHTTWEELLHHLLPQYCTNKGLIKVGRIKTNLYIIKDNVFYVLSTCYINNVFFIYIEDDSYEWRLVNDIQPSVTSRGRLEVRRNHENWGPICVNEDFKNHYIGRDFIPKYINRACNTPLETNVSFAWEILHVGSAIFDSGFYPPTIRGERRGPSPNWGNVKCKKHRVLYLSCDNGMLKIKLCKIILWESVIQCTSF